MAELWLVRGDTDQALASALTATQLEPDESVAHHHFLPAPDYERDQTMPKARRPLSIS